ncbi:hypothetical protein E9993_11155 [Labilibacter sediminis]|nr:hypothetical protein E9993_11155 [Labilibacter sediminis]
MQKALVVKLSILVVLGVLYCLKDAVSECPASSITEAYESAIEKSEKNNRIIEMIELVKGNIKLDLEKPAEGYQGVRFDWTGKAVQLWWGDISFVTTENFKSNSLNEGRGFFNEFGITDPVGYNDCKVGDYFPKIGVGLLKKESNKPYDFFHNYINKPFEFSEVRGKDSVVFHCLNKDFDSAFFLEKKFTITEDGFTIDYLLENVGNKVIETTEYTHNFLSLGARKVSPNTKLIFKGEIKEKQFDKGLKANATCMDDSHTIAWHQIPESDFFFEDIAIPQSKKINWTLIDEELKMGICEQVDFKPAKINLWGRGHVVSPEIFKSIKLKPGEQDQWQRQYKIFQF